MNQLNVQRQLVFPTPLPHRGLLPGPSSAGNVFLPLPGFPGAFSLRKLMRPAHPTARCTTSDAPKAHNQPISRSQRSVRSRGKTSRAASFEPQLAPPCGRTAQDRFPLCFQGALLATSFPLNDSPRKTRKNRISICALRRPMVYSRHGVGRAEASVASRSAA